MSNRKIRHQVRYTKATRDRRIFDLWLACWTQEEIAERESCSVKDVVSDFSAGLPENPKPAAGGSRLTLLGLGFRLTGFCFGMELGWIGGSDIW